MVKRANIKRLRTAPAVATVLLLLGVWAESRLSAREIAGAYAWKLPAGLPLPRVPADNPMTASKVELGRYLFYDKRLSFNQEQACASCHEQSRAFTDGRARAVGSTGEMHPRSSMSLVNIAYVPALGWANPALTQLETQALVSDVRQQSGRARNARSGRAAAGTPQAGSGVSTPISRGVSRS